MSTMDSSSYGDMVDNQLVGDDYNKYNLFGTDSETFKDIMNTVQDIFPEQDTTITDMCSSFDRGIDFSDSQLFSDPYDISPHGLGASMDHTAGTLPKLSTDTERRRQPKKMKKNVTKYDQVPLQESLNSYFSILPSVSGYSDYTSNTSYQDGYREREVTMESLYPAPITNRIQSGAGYHSYENNDNYKDNYRESEIPVINIGTESQIQIFSEGDFRQSGNSSGYLAHTLPVNDDTLFNTINNTDFGETIESDNELVQEFGQTEQCDISNLSDAEKYRRIRDANNEASKKFRRRKKEKISELAGTIPKLEEKNRKLKKKSEQLETLRNDMMKYYNSIFKQESHKFPSSNR